MGKSRKRKHVEVGQRDDLLDNEILEDIQEDYSTEHERNADAADEQEETDVETGLPPKPQRKASTRKPSMNDAKTNNQKPKIGKRKNLTRTQRNEDVILILKSIIKFKARHGGSNPSSTNMKPLYDSVQPKLHQYYDYNTFYRKIRNIKALFDKALIDGVGPTEHDREMFELSVRAWDQDGEMRKKMEEARNKEEACTDFATLKAAMNKHWEDNGLCKKDLERGLELMDKEKALILEKKWRRFMRRREKVKRARLELEKEIRKFMDSELGEGELESEGVVESESADEGEGVDDGEGADESEGDG